MWFKSIDTVNPLERSLNKRSENFTKEDIIKYVQKNNIKILNFRYTAYDGRLKTLNFPVTDREYLNTILTSGERVDGSSLFPFVEAGSSDLYVIPRFSTAYLDPFASIPTLGLLCSYYGADGNPLESSPEYTLKKAVKDFESATGCEFEAMGELEFYIVAGSGKLFNAENQKGYHESTPFAKFEQFRCEAVDMISKVGGKIKYAHCEVGNFELNGKFYEQNEIEFLPWPVISAADQLVMAKWILRTLADKHNVDLTFAPKITKGKAGSGLHFHTRVMKNGKPLMLENGNLSDTAKKVIAGYIKCAGALTAFGNTNPSSYFRLVPHQEAPTEICWGNRNRSALIRVPLGWNAGIDRQTVEIRSADGSADIYLMLAGIVTAARIGLTSADSLEVASKTFIDINIHDANHEERRLLLKKLPASCYESALELEANRSLFETGADGSKNTPFSHALIDGVITKLKSYNDTDTRKEAEESPAKMEELVKKYYYCG